MEWDVGSMNLAGPLMGTDDGWSRDKISSVDLSCEEDC